MFTLSLALLSPPNPFFSEVCKIRNFLLNQGVNTEMLWNSAFHAQGSRVILVAIQVGAVKICVAGVEGSGKKTEVSKQDEIRFATKKWCFSEFTYPSMLIYFFASLFLNLTWFWTKLRVLVLYFPDFPDSSTWASYTHKLYIVFRNVVFEKKKSER